MLKQRVGAGIEKFKVPGKINNPQGVAIAPLNMYASFVYEHFSIHPERRLREGFYRTASAERRSFAARAAFPGFPSMVGRRNRETFTPCRDGGSMPHPYKGSRWRHCVRAT
jgi:hypothetical protein